MAVYEIEEPEYEFWAFFIFGSFWPSIFI